MSVTRTVFYCPSIGNKEVTMPILKKWTYWKINIHFIIGD